jgi:uncharacterized membrane protein
MDGCFGLLAFVFVVALAIWLQGDVAKRLRALEARLDESERARTGLAARLARLEQELRRAASPPGEGPAEPAAAPAPVAPLRPAVEVAAPSVASAPPPPPIVATRPPVAAPPAPTAARPAPPAVAAAPPTAARAAAPAPAAASPAPPPAETRPATAPAPPPRPPAAPPSRPPPAAPAFDWESLVGVRLFSWIAGAALVLATLFFLRYSVEKGWLDPPVRMAMGLATGVALLVVCELKAAHRYRITANAMDAAAIAILFATLFAGHAVWHLLPLAVAFAAMALGTAVAVVLSIRRDSLFVALLGLAGGFATPALLGFGAEESVGLFGYLLLLNAGLAWVAWTKSWPALSLLSLAATTLHQLVWVARFLDASRLPLAASFFLLFPLAGAGALLLAGRRPEGGRGADALARIAAAGALVPLAFAAYFAAVPAFAAHRGLLFGFLAAVVVGLSALAVARGPEELHLAGGGGTLLVFALYFALSYEAASWPSILALVAGFALFFLALPLVARRLGRGFAGAARHGVLAAPLLALFGAALAAIEPATAAPGLLFGTLSALLVAIAAAALALEHGPLWLAGALAGIAAEAVWSVARLAPESLPAALAIYLGFALLYLGVPLLARRFGRALEPQGGGAILLFASLGLLFFLARGAVAAESLWALSLLLLALNLGLFFEGAAGRLPGLAAAGSAVSWLVLVLWWASAPIEARLVPALSVVGAFSILVLAGNLWLRRSARRAAAAGAGEPGEAPEGALWLALVGHAFLFFVALRPALTAPPWPLLATLFALDLAATAAALAVRRGALALASAGAAQVVLLAWAGSPAPWPSGAAVAALLLGARAFLTLFAAERREIDAAARTSFVAGAATGLFLAELVAIVAAARPGRPSTALLALVALAATAGLLALATRAERFALAAWAALPPALVQLSVRLGERPAPAWPEELALAAALWAPFLLYPLLPGARAATRFPALLGAVLSGGATFLFAKDALERGGFEPVLGALPVAQAALLVPLLVRLLRANAPRTLAGARAAAAPPPAETALVAGAILAFVTVAIPLQLEKQWLTLGWALLGAALAWLTLRVPHRGLLFWTLGLHAAVFVRLALNPAVLAYHPRQAAPILNWYLYTYLVAASALLAAAYLLARRDERLLPGLPVSGLLAAGGTVLLFLLLNIEIADFWSAGTTLTFGFLSGEASLGEDLSSTIGWALFAIALLAAGIAGRSRAARGAAIALSTATVGKAFLHDTWNLGGLYRVASLVGLALALALVALALQKFVLARDEPERAEGER